MKIAVIYAKANQTTVKEMFENNGQSLPICFSPTEPSELFLEFIKALGEKIDLSQWQGYRGDMGKGTLGMSQLLILAEGESYFTMWNGFQGKLLNEILSQFSYVSCVHHDECGATSKINWQ